MVIQGNSGNSTLSWTPVSGSFLFCSASGGWSDYKSPTGSEEVAVSFSPTEIEKVYGITCYGFSGTASDSVTITKEEKKQLFFKKEEDCSGSSITQLKFTSKDESQKLTVCDHKNNKTKPDIWMNSDDSCIEMVSEDDFTSEFIAKKEKNCMSKTTAEKASYVDDAQITLYLEITPIDSPTEEPTEIEGFRWREVAP
jgi:hypothetical protein